MAFKVKNSGFVPITIVLRLNIKCSRLVKGEIDTLVGLTNANSGTIIKNMKKELYLSALIFSSILTSCSNNEVDSTDDNTDEFSYEFEKKEFIHTETNAIFPYSSFEPKQATETNNSFPLIIALHGSEYLFKMEEDFLKDEDSAYIALSWIAEKNQKEHPAFVVAPNLHTLLWNSHTAYTNGWTTSIVQDLLDHLLSSNLNIDPNRIYLVGHSMAGSAVWEIGAEMKNELAVIMSFSQVFNVNTPSFNTLLEQIDQNSFQDLAIWDFVHKKDKTNGVISSRVMFDSLQKKNYANPVFTNWYKDTNYSLTEIEIRNKINSGNKYFYTEYDYPCNQESSVGENSECHYVVTKALKNDFVFDWLFQQKRN